MENVIIAISREFASGGRLVGKQLSEKLGIPIFDKEIIQLAAEKSGLSPEFIRNTEEQAHSSLLFSMATSSQHVLGSFPLQYDVPPSDKTFFAQSSVIRELANENEGGCVILGRCGGYILRENPRCVSILLHSTIEDRIERAATVYELDHKGLADTLLKADKARSNYHKYYTGESWLDSRSYDLTLNTAKCGVDGAVNAILSYIGKL